MLDDEWIKSLHVQTLRRSEAHEDHAPHALFQASTVAALLEGAFEGDLSFAELAEHGDIGLGTLNGLDGEMIALDGGFYRADVDGAIHPVPPEAKTPFAVVARFAPTIEEDLQGPIPQIELFDYIDHLVPDASVSCAIRIDGRFSGLRARSVPAQSPPYRPLVEVVAEQRVFELSEVEGTMLGFRFPTYAEGVEIGGYHLHFIDADRERGGHVLDGVAEQVRLRIDVSNELHIELPPGVDLADPGLAAATHEALARAEHDG
ncbi:MAG TPA: acetolactate decarboxylase [Solirubrobacterales bacterium]|nr:acetolactate decarboxylase [Solirubrobacterales bacterium]